jgi:hypothetical protein
MTILTALAAPAAMGLNLHKINVGMIVAIGFLILIFRAWLSK